MLAALVVLGVLLVSINGAVSTRNELAAEDNRQRVEHYIEVERRKAEHVAVLNDTLAHQLVAVASNRQIPLDLRASALAKAISAWGTARAAEQPLNAENAGFRSRDMEAKASEFTQAFAAAIIGFRDDCAAEKLISDSREFNELGGDVHQPAWSASMLGTSRLVTAIEKLGQDFARRQESTVPPATTPEAKRPSPGHRRSPQ